MCAYWHHLFEPLTPQITGGKKQSVAALLCDRHASRLALPFTHKSPGTTLVPAEQITLAHVL